MHTALRMAAAFAAAFVLAACTPKGGANVKITESSFSSDNSEVKAQGFEISGLRNKAFCDEVNRNVKADIDGALVSFDTMVAENEADLIMGNRCILDITQQVKYNQNNILSIIEEHYVYTGGPHGMSSRYPRNYDLENSRQFYLSDIFNDGYKERMDRLMTEQREKDPERYGELWDIPRIRDEHERNFYFTDGRLVIFFAPYELSYYAKGFVEFELPLSELSGVMKEEWRERLIGLLPDA